MRKLLFLLLGLTIAVGASAGVDTWNQQHDAIKQKRHQALGQRSMSHNLLHKATTSAKLRGEGPQAITEQPAGQVATFQRSGTYSQHGKTPQSQAGYVLVVYDPDGSTVYVKGLVTQVYECAWVTGTIANGKITIPLGQYLWTYYGEDGEYYYGIYLDWGSIALNQNNGLFEYTPDTSVTEVTYTIDGDNIVLDNSNGGNEGDGATGLVAMWDDEDMYYAFEWDTEFTPCEIEIPTVITEQPEGEEVTYRQGANFIRPEYDGPYYDAAKTTIVYAPDGETVYIQDLFSDNVYMTWVRGTISGNKIHVPLEQYVYFELADASWTSLAWGTSTMDSESGEFQFTKDPTVTEVTFTIDGDLIYMDNSDLGENGDGATGLLATSYYDYEYYYELECNAVFSPYVEPSVIDEQPEGELVTYWRNGFYFCGFFGEQDGEVNIVYDPDGETVYIQDIIYNSNIGSWVRGTIENGKIHVPMNQYLTWNGPKGSDDGWGYMLAFGQTFYDEDSGYSFAYDPSITEATFTIDGNTISLDNSSFGPDDDINGATGLVVVYSDEPNYFLQCDIYTVFYFDEASTIIYEQPEGELLTLPRSGYYVNERGVVEEQSGTVNIVFAPDLPTVYIQSIIYDGPDTWVKGTIEGDKIHVPLGQYIAAFSQSKATKFQNRKGNRGDWVYIQLNAGQILPDPNDPDYFILDIDPSVTEITFTLTDNGISLDNTGFGPNGDVNGAMAIAAVPRDNPQYYFQCDLLTVFGTPETPPTVTVITEQPEGELVTYYRSGEGIFMNDPVWKGQNEGDRSYIGFNNVRYQTGVVNVVYAPDGETVYMQDPVDCNWYYNTGAWVKGTLSADGTKISVPVGQYVSWDSSENFGKKLAWGSTTVEPYQPEETYTQEIIFTPDPDVTEITYTIQNGCIYLDNSDGPSVSEHEWLIEMAYSGQFSDERVNNLLDAMYTGIYGVAYVDNHNEWTHEINWGTVYVGKHPTTLPDPEIYGWYDYNNENGNNRLEVEVPYFDTDSLPIYEDALSYSIYTDNNQLFTFEASKYGLDEDVTEVTYDMWQDSWRLDPYAGIRFFRTNAEGFEPFFTWRIGIQFHYTVNGVKHSTNIVYLEVFEHSDVVPGDVNGDGEVSVGDVTILIDSLLGGDLSAINVENADFNGDQQVNVADVTALIDWLLGN